MNRIICLLKHSLVSSTFVISVVSTFNIALVFLNLYAMLLFIAKSSLRCATEIIYLIDIDCSFRRIFHGEAALVHASGDIETILYLYCRHLADAKPGLH